MRAFDLFIGAAIAVGTLTYRLITAPARKRLAATTPKWREIVVNQDTIGNLYVIVRRMRLNRRHGSDLSPTHLDYLDWFEKTVQDFIYEFEHSKLAQYTEVRLRYEINVWRSTWFTLIATPKNPLQGVQNRTILYLE